MPSSCCHGTYRYRYIAVILLTSFVILEVSCSQASYRHVTHKPSIVTALGSGWIKVSQVGEPPARAGGAMTYDAATKMIVLFGGMYQMPRGGYLELHDTWLWNGAIWHQAHPPINPPIGLGASMVYDPATRSVVLFGSVHGETETWGWNGTTWKEYHTVQRPPPYSLWYPMVYDNKDHLVVLVQQHFSSAQYGMWTWNGVTWKEHPAPLGMELPGLAAMAYDQATGDVVLYGGPSPSKLLAHKLGISSSFVSLTWTWNGSIWLPHHTESYPSAYSSSTMVYDTAARVVVLFGGDTFNGHDPYPNSTWVWNGTTWKELRLATSPSGRSEAQMAYDPVNKTIVLFGGERYNSHYLGDTWLLKLPGALP